jgi:hypothetical protein
VGEVVNEGGDEGETGGRDVGDFRLVRGEVAEFSERLFQMMLRGHPEGPVLSRHGPCADVDHWFR